MVIYNVTINVTTELIQEWLDWMKSTHIPQMMATGKFQGHRILRVVSRSEGEEGETFAIQYFCENIKKLQEYETKYAKKLRQEHTEKYKDGVVAFRTILEDL